MSGNPDNERTVDDAVTFDSSTGVNADSSTITTTESCACSEPTDEESFGSLKRLEMLANLWPNGSEPSVTVEELLDFFSHILGPFYNKEVATCLVDIMSPDAEGKITRENFSRAFCLDNWPKEHVAAMRRVFIIRPEIINEIVDWKAVLDRMGLNMSNSDLNEVIELAKSSATEMLKKDAREVEDLEVDSEKVNQKSEEILNMILEKLGKNNIDCSCRNLPSGEGVEPSSQENN